MSARGRNGVFTDDATGDEARDTPRFWSYGGRGRPIKHFLFFDGLGSLSNDVGVLDIFCSLLESRGYIEM